MKIYKYQNQKNICGERVKEYRRQMQMSQTELASSMQLYGITLDQKAISRIELMDRFVTDYELCVLAKVLEVKIEQLLQVDPQQRPKKE